MQKKNILFLSTNGSWGGSEVLWSMAAASIASPSIQVSTGTFYGEVAKLRESEIPATNLGLSKMKVQSLAKRIVRKVSRGKLYAEYFLTTYLKDKKPDLVVISQGNNFDGKDFMLSCISAGVKFVTITHLVTKAHWYFLNDRSIEELTNCYVRAHRNYFVASESLRIHEQMIGSPCENAEIIFNPFINKGGGNFPFPDLKDGYYKIALVGRHELFHKGYDLLLEVLASEEWKSRPVKFNIFGKGPHTDLLSRLISICGNPHVKVQAHQEDVENIWRAHHLLLMPSRMEGQSLSLLEAMHYNRAAIVTRRADNADMVEDGVTGFIAPHANTESLAETMERAWAQRNEWESMGLAAGRSARTNQPANAVDFFNQKLLAILN